MRDFHDAKSSCKIDVSSRVVGDPVGRIGMAEVDWHHDRESNDHGRGHSVGVQIAQVRCSVRNDGVSLRWSVQCKEQ